MSFPQDAGIRSLREKTMAIRADLYRREHPGVSLISLRVSPWIPIGSVDIPEAEAVTTSDLVMPCGGSATMGLFLFNAGSQEMTVKFSATVRDTTVARCRTSVAGFITAADLICTPDPLIPVHDGVSLSRGESKLIVLSVEGNIPGRTEMFVQAQCADTTIVLSESIEVVPLALPQRTTLRTLTWSYLDYPLIADRKEEALSDLRNHRTNVVVVPPSYLVDPDPERPLFRTRLLGYLRAHAGFETALLYLEFRDQELRSIHNRYAYLSPEWRSWFTRWYRTVMAVAQEAGFDPSRVLLYPFDEMRGEEIDQFVRLASWVRGGFDGARFYATIDKSAATRVLPYLAVAQFVEKPGLAAPSAENGPDVWRYILLGKSVPPYAGVRLMMWRAFLDGIGGVGFWNYADIGWGDKRDNEWNDFDGSHPDYTVVYRNGPGPLLSSRRWEAWRTGIEDYEILQLYAAHHGIDAARQIARQVTENPTRTTRADQMRSRMLRDLAGVPNTPAPPQKHKQSTP